MSTKIRKSIMLHIMLVLILLTRVFGVTSAQAEPSISLGWARRMGSISIDVDTGYDAGLSIALDGNGNVYTAGIFSGTVDFDPGSGTTELTSVGGYDIFITRFDNNGDFVWVKSIGGIMNDWSGTIALDDNGNIYVSGNFRDTVDFDPTAGSFPLISAGNGDIFILKLNNSGGFIWAKRFGATQFDSSSDFTWDSDGNLYITGNFADTVDFGTGNLISAGGQDIFVGKLDSNGNALWVKNMGGTSNDSAHEIVLDGNKNIHLLGGFSGTADFDPGTGTANLTSVGNSDIFISKLDADGIFVWAKSMGSASLDNGNDMLLDGNGNVYTIGGYQGTVDFDPGAGTSDLTSSGSYDIFIQKLDSSGNFAWVKGIGGNVYDEAFGLAMDASGNIYITGGFGGFGDAVDFDPGPGTSNLTTVGYSDIFVTRFDGTGNFVWAKSMGGLNFELGHEITLDEGENLYITGEFEGTVDFDPNAGTSNLTSAGNSDIFIVKLISAPQVLYVKWDATGANDGTSWTDAYTDLQSALAAASSGDEIWVAAGTYYPTSGTDRTISFVLQNGVAIYGGFDGTETLRSERDPSANVTVLSGDLGVLTDKDDNSYHVVVGSGTNNTAVLDGVTIMAGNADDGSSGLWAVGGGIQNDAGSPLLRNLMIVDNSAFSGGGMHNENNSDPILINVTFHVNDASFIGGGMANSLSNPSLTNVTFNNNFATLGGGMGNLASDPVLTNVTLRGNEVPYNAGGGMYNSDDSNPQIDNSIFWDNSAPNGAQIYNENSSPQVNDSVVEGGCPTGSLCTNTITTDPLLAALDDHGGFTKTISLLPGSSAIDAGNNSTCAATDQRGVSRPQGSYCDIGAYEVKQGTLNLAGSSAFDGWILESTETSNLGGTLNKTATTLRVGDDAANKQYRSILSFDTSSLPHDAVITKVTLRIAYAGRTGTSPFKTHGNLLVDLKIGNFGTSNLLQKTDFQAPATLKAAGIVGNVPVSTSIYQSIFTPTTLTQLNNQLSGIGFSQLQFRLRFTKDDNNDFGADFLKFYSGDADEANRPQLVIEYYVP